MSEGLKKAQLVPFDSNGETLLTAEAIDLDFNPESLTIQVSSGQELDAKRRGNQQVQHVGYATATLSFDAIFDSTRPRGLPGEAGDATADPEKLDVRYKTAAIANLLQVEAKGQKPAPRRVQFAWGTTQFEGLIQSFSETLDFFSPEGVPLRSKVSIRITEQSYRYRVDSSQVARSAPQVGAAAAGAIAAGNGLDSLFELSAGAGFAFDAALDLDAGFAAGAGIGAGASAGFDAALGVDVGVDVDLGFSATAGIDLDAGAALELFGGAAVAAQFGAGVDLGLALGDRSAQARGAAAGGATPAAAWAPGGPAPGSKAAELGALVQQTRAAGVADEASARRGSVRRDRPDGATGRRRAPRRPRGKRRSRRAQAPAAPAGRLAAARPAAVRAGARARGVHAARRRSTRAGFGAGAELAARAGQEPRREDPGARRRSVLPAVQERAAMIHIGEVHSEVVVGGGDSGRSTRERTQPSLEVRLEELREPVRQLVREEMERMLRQEIDR